jgi:hypothetical protein
VRVRLRVLLGCVGPERNAAGCSEALMCGCAERPHVSVLQQARVN